MGVVGEEQWSLLIVEDHEAILESLAERLGREPDFVVIGKARTAAEALACVASERPDITLLDINLPDEDGVVLARRLLTSDPTLCLVATTGDPSPVLTKTLLGLGVRGVVDKVHSLTILTGALRDAASGRPIRVTPPTTPLPQLSPRMLELLLRLDRQCTDLEIAQELGISFSTVREHLARLYERLGVTHRGDALVIARRWGFLR